MHRGPGLGLWLVRALLALAFSSRAGRGVTGASLRKRKVKAKTRGDLGHREESWGFGGKLISGVGCSHGWNPRSHGSSEVALAYSRLPQCLWQGAPASSGLSPGPPLWLS